MVIFGTIGVIVLLITCGGVVIFLSRRSSTLTPSPSVISLTNTDSSTVSQIKQLLGIPASEEPTIADVKDSSKMASQPFFSSSQNGDQVLVFAQSKKIVLYRPSTGKVINLAPLNDDSSSSAQIASTSATPEVVKIVVRNGTTTQGLASKFQSQIKQILPQAQTSGENAAKTDYKTGVIVVLNSQAQTAAQTLSQKLGINIGNLPEGEKKPTADLLIIVGQDKAK